MKTDARTITASLAGAVQELELNGKSLVTLDDLRGMLPPSKMTTTRIASELMERGWLRALGIRGTYEFIPGAAAGPYPSGDPWIAFRAALRQGTTDVHVGAASAAWFLGYAQRSPAQHILVARTGATLPLALTVDYTVHHTEPAPASSIIEGLPVPTPAELFAEVAQIAPRLHLDSAQGWLRRLLASVTADEIADVLRERSMTTRARAGYIAEVCGATEHASAIARLGNVGRGPYYTGPRVREGSFSPRWRVYDTARIS